MIHPCQPQRLGEKEKRNEQRSEVPAGLRSQRQELRPLVVIGSRWSDVVGERIYGVFQIDNNGNKISNEMNLVESCLA